MTWYGVDPDLHRTAVASIWESGSWKVVIVPVPDSVKGRDAMLAMCTTLVQVFPSLIRVDVPRHVAVEGQDFRTRGNARFEDIGHLACITGAAIALARTREFSVESPLPSEWKGNIPKSIHHLRIARELGFEVVIKGGPQRGYGVPIDPKIRSMLPLASDWKHGMDALGLALWARNQTRRHA